MTGTTHIAIALAGALAYSAYAGQSPNALGWSLVVVGSLAPDIDGQGTVTRPGSLLGKLLPRFIAKIIDRGGMTLSGIIRAILGHRGVTHWLIWPGLMLYFGDGWLWWFGFGWLAHILADFCTVSGVPLFGPLWNRDIKWSPIRTGTWPEWLFISPAAWLTICYYSYAYLPLRVQSFSSRMMEVVWKLF